MKFHKRFRRLTVLAVIYTYQDNGTWLEHGLGLNIDKTFNLQQPLQVWFIFHRTGLNSWAPGKCDNNIESPISWWRHQMEIFSALLAICAGNSPVLGEFPTQKPVTRSFDVFFDLRLNKRLGKQWWGWWFETLSRPLWRHRNVLTHSMDWIL